MRKTMITMALLAAVITAADVEIGTTGSPRGFPFGC